MKSDPSLCRYTAHLTAILLVIITSFSINTLTITNGHVAEASFNERETEALKADIIKEDGFMKQELLWFARAIYSETKVPEEQRLIAWVIRNRVESGRYSDTYMGVVLQPRQFSGFNPSDSHYGTNTTIVPGDVVEGWDTAQTIAEEVYSADVSERPLTETVWHFYSPVSARYTPSWAREEHLVEKVHDPVTQAVRFAFYANVK